MNKGRKSAKHSAPTSKRANRRNKNFFSNIIEGFKAMSKGKKALVISLISVILIIVILIGIILGVIGDLTQDYNHQEIDDPDIQKIEPIDEKIVNIALFGIDSRDQDFTGLSDSIMVLSVNTGTGDIKLISIMRDSFVKLPELKGKTYRPNKINSAYSRGGAAYAIKTLNHNFGLDIKEYATVNFYGMAEIIDAVGGIEIEVLQREINAKNGLNDCLKEQAAQLGIENPPLVTESGVQVLSGIQAVAWARIRSVSTDQGTANDYGRTDRQRIVMEKLLNKALSMDVSQYPNLIKTILPHVETSLSFGEVLSLATNVLGQPVNFQQTRVPQPEYVMPISGASYAGSVVYYDLAFATKIIHAIIYDGVTQEEYITQNGIEKNKWYTGEGVVSSKPSNSNSNSSNQSSSNQSASSSVVSSPDTNSSQTSSTVSENNSSKDSSSATEETFEDQNSSSSQENTSSQDNESEEIVSTGDVTSSEEPSSSETITSSEETTSSDTIYTEESTSSEDTISAE